jgi:hypothetical protein
MRHKIEWQDFTHYQLTETGYTILLNKNKNNKIVAIMTDDEYMKLQSKNDWRY